MDSNSLAKRIKASTFFFKKKENIKYRSLQGAYIKHREWLKVESYKKIN